MNILMHILENVSYIDEQCTFYRTFCIIQYEHNNAHFTERFV